MGRAAGILPLTSMSTHAEVVKLIAAIDGALDSLADGNAVQAATLLYRVLPAFDDSRLSSNQEVWQLYEPFLAVATVCASRIPDEADGGIQLLSDAVRLKLNRIRPQ
jgi:hypothetical protein